MVSDPYHLPRWWPRRVAGRERRHERRRRAPQQWTKVLETSRGRAACAPTTAASARPSASATSGSRRSRARRSSASCAARELEIRLEPSRRGTEVTADRRAALRGLSRFGSPMMRRGHRARPRRGARRPRAGADASAATVSERLSPRGAIEVVGVGRPGERARARRGGAGDAARAELGELEPAAAGRARRRSTLPRAAAAAGGGRRRRSARSASSPRAEDRVRHAAGKGYPDLVRLRRAARGRARRGRCCRPTPTRSRARARGLRRARASPSCRSAAARASSAASSRSATRFERLVALDLARMRDVEVDRRSLTARLGAGLRGPEAEAALGAQGSRSATSRSRSSTRRSAAWSRRARRARPRPATGASTSSSPRLRLIAPAGELRDARDARTPRRGRRCAS